MNSFGKDSNFDQDERLSRRLKRRFGIHISPNKSKRNSAVNATSLDIVPTRGITSSFNSDYALYLNSHPGSEDHDYDHDAIDRDYLAFLKHSSKIPNSLALYDAMPLQTTYQKHLLPFVVDAHFTLNNFKRLKDVPSRDRVKTKPKAFRTSDKNKENPKPLRSSDKNKQKSKALRSSGKNKENPNAFRSVPNKKRKISSTLKDVKPECRARVTPTQKPRPLMPEVKKEMGSAVKEEEDCYENFLKCLKLDGARLVMVTKDLKEIKYEQDDENASDSDFDIEMTDTPQIGAPSPFETSKIYYLEGKSSFREKLANILQKPFDQKEYNELYKEASERKPLERHIDLRGRTKRCVVLESVGKSYLDHHPDLKNEIHSVRRNPYLVLKLLRGFFFWLENVAEEGGFRPWSDKLCLKQLRQG